jgi:uncharacterized membrane protein YebE (DUF533 family)
MDLNRIVSSMVSSGVLGGLAGGAVSGALVSSKKARKAAGTALKLGGIAALGAVAWKAYHGYQANRGTSPGPAGATAAVPARPDPVWQDIPEQRFAISEENAVAGSTAVLLVQAMIAAACADGHLDAEERSRILDRAEDLGLAPDEKALVVDALQAPLTLADLCGRVDSPELALEVYLASALAVDRSRREATLYLDALAFRLGLPPALVDQVHADLRQGEGRKAA